MRERKRERESERGSEVEGGRGRAGGKTVNLRASESLNEERGALTARGMGGDGGMGRGRMV